MLVNPSLPDDFAFTYLLRSRYAKALLCLLPDRLFCVGGGGYLGFWCMWSRYSLVMLSLTWTKLMQMNGLAGKSGWRWIFIMEGVVGNPVDFHHGCYTHRYLDYLFDRHCGLLVARRLSRRTT